MPGLSDTNNRICILGSSACDQVFAADSWPQPGARKVVASTYKRPGGNAVNIAMVMASLLEIPSQGRRSNAEISLFAPTSEGKNGSRVLIDDYLKRTGLKVHDRCDEDAVMKGSRTPISTIRVWPPAQDCSIVHQMNGNATFNPLDVLFLENDELEKDCHCDYFVVAGLGLMPKLESSIVRTVERVRTASNCIVVVDTNFLEKITPSLAACMPELLSRTDIFVPNFDEAIQTLRATSTPFPQNLSIRSNSDCEELAALITKAFKVRVATIVKRGKYGFSLALGQSFAGQLACQPYSCGAYDFAAVRDKLLSRVPDEYKRHVEPCVPSTLGCGDSWLGAFLAYLFNKNFISSCRFALGDVTSIRSGEVDSVQLVQDMKIKAEKIWEHVRKAGVIGNAAAVHCMAGVGSTDWIAFDHFASRHLQQPKKRGEFVSLSELITWHDQHRIKVYFDEDD